jgi:hypothetical protein
MAEGFSAAGGNTALDALLAAYRWIQPHLGAPGSAGTSNQAATTTRRQATFASAAAGSATTSAEVRWTAPGTTEAWTHFSAWSASSAGTFGFSGTITGGTVTSGVDFSIAAGGLVVSVTTAS